MNWGKGKCPIWDTDCSISEEGWTHTVRSERAGGIYRIPIDVVRQLSHPGGGLKNDRAKAILTTWIASRQAERFPLVSRKIIDSVNNGEFKPLNPIVRAERLLRHISESSVPGEMLDVHEIVSSHEVLVLTESLSEGDVQLLVKWLVSSSYFFYPLNNTYDYIRVSLDGYQRLAELDTPNTESDQVFVAMWFNDDTKQLRERIRSAVKAASLNPYFVDEDLSNQDKVSDRIELEIRRSRLIVADFTHGKDGARGSVYYEAGLARGLGLPVVWTCRGSQLDDLHFDTNHYPHLGWSEETLADFQRALTDRLCLITLSGE